MFSTLTLIVPFISPYKHFAPITPSFFLFTPASRVSYVSCLIPFIPHTWAHSFSTSHLWYLPLLFIFIFISIYIFIYLYLFIFISFISPYKHFAPITPSIFFSSPLHHESLIYPASSPSFPTLEPTHFPHLTSGICLCYLYSSL